MTTNIIPTYDYHSKLFWQILGNCLIPRKQNNVVTSPFIYKLCIITSKSTSFSQAGTWMYTSPMHAWMTDFVFGNLCTDSKQYHTLSSGWTRKSITMFKHRELRSYLDASEQSVSDFWVLEDKHIKEDPRVTLKPPVFSYMLPKCLFGNLNFAIKRPVFLGLQRSNPRVKG